MALNLVRNSKVFFTTNVNGTTGVINSSGFSSLNTYEVQVLDGFTFSQATNQETVTVSEAGSDPVRGQRAFNTSLNPVDFSMSTYLRPALISNTVSAEESVLWNALLSSTAIDSVGTALGGTPVATYSYAAGTGTLELTGVTFAVVPSIASYVTITGLTHANTNGEVKFLNAPAKVIDSSATTLKLEYINPYTAAIATIGASATTTKIYTSTGWAPNGSSYAIASSASSNKNQLQKFGMLFLVDNVLYGVDNASMTQVSIDFGIDAIATAAWTGQGTVLRKLADGAVISNGTITALTEVLGGATVSAAAGGTGVFTATVTLTTAIASNISTGQTVTATGGVGAVGTGATVVSVTRDTSGKVVSFTITGGVAHTNGAVTGVTVTTLASGAYVQKNTSASYLTNKISTVSLVLVNDLKDALNNTIAVKGATYSVALTGGSFTLNNNVTYLTPANLSVVNLPIANFTGARAISGSMTAYLKTGVGEGGTGQLLSDLLAAASNTVEPMFALKLNIGGNVNNRVELDMPGAMLTIPTVDVQQVVSTTINFMGQATTPSASSGSTYALDELNDVLIRYYAV